MPKDSAEFVAPRRNFATFHGESATTSEDRWRLDLSTSPRFREKVEEELNYDPSIKHLVLDLQDTTFIDSSGLGVILGRFKRISAQGGKLLAVRVPSHLVKVFELSGLLRIMEICPTPEDAQKSLLGG